MVVIFFTISNGGNSYVPAGPAVLVCQEAGFFTFLLTRPMMKKKPRNNP